MPAPLIGITGRRIPASIVFSNEASIVGGHRLDIYFSAHADRLAALGALPVLIPYPADPETLVERLDGLVLSGGNDVDPDLYGGHPSGYPIDRERDEFEIALLRATLAHDLPTLAVCRGLQLTNVAFGGTLFEDLGRVNGGHHYNPDRSFDVRHHSVTFAPGSLAARVWGPSREVNSSHRQAVRALGSGLVASGRSDGDGVVEAIEIPGRRLLAAQWHPEALADDPSFEWLVSTARDHATAVTGRG